MPNANERLHHHEHQQHHHDNLAGVPVAEEVEVADAVVSAVLPGYVTATDVFVLSEEDGGAGQHNWCCRCRDLRSGDQDKDGGEGRSRRGSSSRRKLAGMAVLAGLLVVAVAVAVAVAVVPGNNNTVGGVGKPDGGTTMTSTATRSDAPPEQIMGKETERLVSLRELLDRILYRTDATDTGTTSPLLDRTTYQYSALRWLADVDELDLPLPDAPATAEVASIDDERTQRIVQRYALVALYYGTTGEGWRVHGNFLDATLDECQWNAPLSGARTVGVRECNDQGFVTLLFLARNRLKSISGGGIPDELFQLRHLHEVNLSGNDLGGTLSPKVNQLSNLRVLSLDDTKLRGEPPNMTELTRLEVFSACCNELTAMPMFTDLNGDPARQINYGEWVNDQIKSIDVSNNRIAWSVPEEYATYPWLHTLNVQGNFLVGSVDFLCDAYPTIDISVDSDEVLCYCCD